MIDGTYTAHFSSNLGSIGDGVVTILRGKVSGGDSNYRYSGTLVEKGGKLVAQITVQHYAGPMNSIFGALKSFCLDLQGVMRADAGRLEGHMRGQAQLRIEIVLKLVEQMAAE